MKGSTILQILTLIVCVYVTYFTYQSFKEIGQLRAENELIMGKLDSLRNIAPVTADKPTEITPQPVSANQNIRKEPSNSVASKISDKPAKRVTQSHPRKSINEVKKTSVKIRVSASYRIEDRYVLSNIILPDTIGQEPGKVTVNILIDQVGSVKRTSIASTDGITDENVLDACRKAALKTNFNVNTDAPKAQPGTITYTFAAQ